MKNIIKFILCCSVFVFLGCGDKGELYNLSDKEWLEVIVKDLSKNNIEDASKHFNVMSAEHINSQLTKHAMLMIANAHLIENEYLLANFYFDEYSKKFGSLKMKEYFDYAKIKSKYLSFTKPNRDQSLLNESLDDIEVFMKNYPYSDLLPLVVSMKTRFVLANYYLDMQIASLYKRMGNKISYEIYEKKLKEYDFSKDDIQEPYMVWYKKIFE